jgi:hypothetical protein
LTYLKGNTFPAKESLRILADLTRGRTPKPLEELNPLQLADLFLLMEKTFPSKGRVRISAKDKDVYENIERLRWSIPQRLKRLASQESCSQLLRLSTKVTHHRTKLRWHMRDARLAFVRSIWTGVPLSVLTGFAAKRESRWVRSPDDLLDLLMDSLARLQEKLNSKEHPTFRRLWNEAKEGNRKKLTPKDESVLTEEIIDWFKEDLSEKHGLVLGCQVKPSSIHETDIEVKAIPAEGSSTGGSFCVTIEVKRDYNPEVQTSLEKQLVQEYLLKLGRAHGIYVVGWYEAQSWRKKANPLRADSHQHAESEIKKLLLKSQEKHPTLRLSAFCLNCEYPQAFRKR